MRLRSSRTSNSPDIEAHEHIQESPDPCQTCVPLLSSDSHIAYKKQTYASEEEHKLSKVDTSEFNSSNIDDTASPHSSYQSSSDDSDGDYIIEEDTVLHDHAETEATFQKRKLSAASIAIAEIKYDISESVEYLGIADEAKYNTRKRQKSLDNKTRKQRTDLELDTISEGDQDVNLDNKKSKEEIVEEETEYERNYSGVKTRSKSQQASQSNNIQGLTDYKSVGKRESDNQQAESFGMITRRKLKSVETNKSYNVIKTKSSNPVKKSPKVERKQSTRAKRPYPPIPSIVNTRSISKEPEPIVKEEETNESPLAILEGGQQIQIKDLVVLDTVLGEGQIGTVNLAKYKNLLVACKSKRSRTKREPFYFQIQRELKFAAKLSVCRNINRYIGWIYCERSKVEPDVNDKYGVMKLYVIQRYVANGDARSYLDKRESTFQPAEVLQASICLFSALADAHELGIGIVDLKLENFLVDSSGAGWLTDFGSCIEFNDREEVDLEDEEVAWTINVASPEMIKKQHFSKASDVFMATLIIAELLTAEYSDDEFYDHILKRKSNGRVEFSPQRINSRYEAFFDLLTLGLSNESSDRPSANNILTYLLKMKSV